MNVNNYLVTIMQHVITQKETIPVHATQDSWETDVSAKVQKSHFSIYSHCQKGCPLQVCQHTHISITYSIVNALFYRIEMTR